MLELADSCTSMALAAKARDAPAPPRPYLGAMLDPRTHAMSFAFPILKNDRAWTAKVSAVPVELKPTKRQHEDILIEAARISARLKRELSNGAGRPCLRHECRTMSG